MKNLNYYLTLPYTVILRKDEDGSVVGQIAELQGCSMHGKTEAEALRKLNETKEDWLADAIKHGDPIPEPEREEDLPSGKWLQRVPRSLHLQLSQIAKKEGVSLNQWVTAILAEAVGHRRSEPVLPLKVTGVGARTGLGVASRVEVRALMRHRTSPKAKGKTRK